MAFAMTLLVGLAAFTETLASPLEFVSVAYATPSPPSTPTSTLIDIPALKSMPLIAERTVSTTTSGSTAPGWSFISCFTDNIDARALLTQVHIVGGPEAMSVSQCNYRCLEDGYILSGVEFAHECWCDHALNGEYHVKVHESECNMACTGNNTETCGGANRIAIYEYSSTPALETWKPILTAPALDARSVDIMSWYGSIGCFQDSTTSRMLGNYIPSPGADRDMTVDKCATECYNLGFPYAGLEYGHECFCDSLMQTLITATASECNMACPGNSGETCGGDLRINIYSYYGPTPLTATSTTALHAISTPIMTKPTNLPITAPGGYASKGCYSDVSYNRTLGFIGSFPGSREAMTIQPCQDACKYAGFDFAGLEFGHECWCDNAIRDVGIKVSDSDCNMACSGNSSENCGGSNRIHIYSFTPATSTNTMTTTASSAAESTPSMPQQPTPYFTAIGCYTDSRSNRSLGFVGDFPGAKGNMSINPCLDACKNARYMFAGVEFGDECWCDDVIRGISTLTFSADCNMPCTGNASEICGGRDRVNVYQLILAPTKSTSMLTAISTSASPASSTSPPDSTSICIGYYQVAQGDYCYSIWTGFHISQEQFARWNPTLVFPQCQIHLGQSLCVQQGLAGSQVVTITKLPPASTPTDEMSANSLVLATGAISSTSIAVAPTSMSTSAGLTTAISASTVSCSVFYEVTKDDYCYEIWTSFGITQDQFRDWNPSLVFPACRIFPGDLLCVQVGSGSTTTITSLPAAATATSNDSTLSTSTVSTTFTSTVIVMTHTLSNSDFLTVTPFTVNSVHTPNITPVTSEATSSMRNSKSGY